MAFYLITPPLTEPVGLDEVHDFLRLSGSDEDVLLTRLIQTAREVIEQYCGISLIEQGWLLRLSNWPSSDRLALYKSPLRSIERVYAHSFDGSEINFSATDWHLNQEGRLVRLYLKKPLNINPARGVNVELTCGFGTSMQDVPEPLRHAVLMLVAHLYEFRGGLDAEAKPLTLPPVINQLLAPWQKRGRL